MSDDDTTLSSATKIAAAIRDRELSPVEVMDATLAKIEARNPSLNAFVYEAFDESRASAVEAERQVMAGAPLGPLHGVPLAMKDLFDFKPGWPSTFGGIPALRDQQIPAYCVWAERMEHAGGIIVGKTNAPSLGMRLVTDNQLFGPARNPFDTSRNAGGSSGGSAAAIADGLVTIAEGTDAGGSSRVPAAWCGAFGFKGSWGRVPFVLRPNAFASTLISRFRSRRLIWFGPVAARTSATCDSRTTRAEPSAAAATLIGIRCRSAMSLRLSGVRRTLTS